jgi:hypothetical protein
MSAEICRLVSDRVTPQRWYSSTSNKVCYATLASKRHFPYIIIHFKKKFKTIDFKLYGLHFFRA